MIDNKTNRQIDKQTTRQIDNNTNRYRGRKIQTNKFKSKGKKIKDWYFLIFFTKKVYQGLWLALAFVKPNITFAPHED